MLVLGHASGTTCLSAVTDRCQRLPTELGRATQGLSVVVRLPPLSIFHFQLYIILSWTFTWPYTLAIWTFRALYSPFNHIRHTRYFSHICPPTSDACARPPPIGLDPQLIDLYLVPVSPFIIATCLASIRLHLASTISTLFNQSRFHQS